MGVKIVQGPSTSAGGTTDFADDVFRVHDDGDASKKVALQVSGVSTGTTRTWTVQNANGTVPLLEVDNTFTTRQDIAPLTDVVGLRITAPAGSSQNAFQVYSNDLAAVTSWIDPTTGGNYAPIFVINEIGGANNIAILNKTTISVSRTYSVDNSIASTDFMMTGGTQTVAGIKTFSGASILLGAIRLNMDGAATRVHFGDQTDTTKKLAMLLSGIATATTRQWTVGNWNGTVAAPVGDGTAAQVLTSNGAGVQPSWQATSATLGRATVDFTTGFEQAIVTVADAGVGAASKIVASMAYVAPPDGRSIDELLCETFDVKPGNVVAGVSFDILVTSLVGPAYGQFSVDYTRS